MSTLKINSNTSNGSSFAGKRFHFIGIAGVAMGTVALMLKEAGYQVKGSDEHIYPPMSDQLARYGISVDTPFRAENIAMEDVVVIGNALSRGNPEVEYVLNSNIDYYSMTDIIHELFLKGRDVVAVAGTHGKSTTTGLLAHILTVAGKDPSFLVGGELKNYQANYRLGNGDFFIIEGDEYDSAFFEKWPKVIAYRPKYLVLTSLEFDHGDIYRDLHELEKWFTYLIRLIPGKNTIISSGKYETLRSILEEGFSPVRYTGDDIRYSSHEGLLAIELNKGRVECRPHLKGDFNHENIALAAAMAENLGIELQSIQEGIETYRGIKRRQEVLLEEKSLVVIEDFAHHPTAIKAVTESLSQEYPRWKIWQLYEPASATGARNIFQADLPDSFLPHQPVLLYKSPRLSRLSLENRLDLLQVKKDLEARECRVAICSSGEDIVKQLAKGFDSGEKNIIIILSNGSFDGAAEKIVAWVKNEIIS